jgi:hypothetical protein
MQNITNFVAVVGMDFTSQSSMTILVNFIAKKCP